MLEALNGVNRYLVCEMSIFQASEVFFFPISRCKSVVCEMSRLLGSEVFFFPIPDVRVSMGLTLT